MLRHLALSLITATVVPGALFYLCLTTLGLWAALGAALAWCYAFVAWRLVTRRPVSGLLLLTLMGLTARTAWASVCLVKAAATTWLVLTLSMPDVVLAKTLAFPVLTASAAGVTVIAALRVVRAEGLGPRRRRTRQRLADDPVLERDVGEPHDAARGRTGSALAPVAGWT